MIVNGGRAGGVDFNAKPRITYDGKWTGWYLEVYNGTPYWEALFSTSGHLVALADYTCDAWGIGGGGHGGLTDDEYGGRGTGAGSGFTNLVEGIIIAAGGHYVTIGAGATAKTDTGLNQTYEGSTGHRGGTTTFLSFSADGGYGGGIKVAGTGGSNGALDGKEAGFNGTPGAGKIMSKFWSEEHNTEYGAAGVSVVDDAWNRWGAGGGGYRDFGAPGMSDGRGYGAGGSGMGPLQHQSGGCQPWGHDGCLILRIKAE